MSAFLLLMRSFEAKVAWVFMGRVHSCDPNNSDKSTEKNIVKNLPHLACHAAKFLAVLTGHETVLCSLLAAEHNAVYVDQKGLTSDDLSCLKLITANWTAYVTGLYRHYTRHSADVPAFLVSLHNLTMLPSRYISSTSTNTTVLY